jgi:hypothetical protein
MRDKGTGHVVLNQCTQEASLKFLFVSHSMFSEFLKSYERRGCTKKHKCATVQKNINVENKFENCICKRIFWFFLTENLHISVNWLAYSEGQENFYHSEKTRKPLTLNKVASV